MLSSRLLFLGLLTFLGKVRCDIKYVTNTIIDYEVTTRTYTTLSTQWSTDTVNQITISLSYNETIQDESTTTITSTIFTYTTLEAFPSEALVSHNTKRRLHQNTPDLLWSDIIAQSAQNYADAYNCNGTLIHSGNSNYGENLALGYNTTAAIEAWYDEIDLYDYRNPIFGENTGHFTQLVWKNSTYIGCGTKYCDEYYGDYTICQYWAPGNYKGQFSSNVMPLK